MIYLDYAATTPVDEDVLDTYARIQKEFYANTNSLHLLGQRSNYLFEKIKQETAGLLGINGHNLVFTGSASEANNIAILGIARKYPRGKIITTKIEHPSVYAAYRQLEREGLTVKYLDVDSAGVIDTKQLAGYLDSDVVLVSIMWVNNIVGAVQPIKEAAELIKLYPKAKLHVDAAQGLCKIEPEFALGDIDLLTFSSHKIYGPKGVGLLAFKKNIEFEKIMHGSDAQYNVRPGTVDLAGAAAFCKAVKKFYPETSRNYKAVKRLNRRLREKLGGLPGVIINGGSDASPYIFNISIPGRNGETIVHGLEKDAIFVSTGSACSSKLKEPERTILNMTGSKDIALSSVRISLSHRTSDDDLDKLTESLRRVINNV
ncbi:MAG: cysteine desulfurase family protein [Bacilli bacterium]|nr:cysteine desulfurase family protein [Bacillota bacterium]NLM31253.1 cysteine desulfurase [Acholeplasmataceae bacterium]HOA78191.1 cysteine desulfurase family protein [Bacilli bacterium]HPZ26539.1 cysteine desulfurase family protein [Bacilli bacterium]HQC89013.1 cysteine desulfurase family protein [Bacilli bacterium]